MLPWTAVAIAGDSMIPAMRPGDWWLVRRTTRVRPGHVVAFWHPQRIDLLTVKRVSHAVDGGWWVLGDNPQASDDSRTFGPVDPSLIVGRLVLRYRRAA